MSDLEILRELEGWFEGEMHRTISFKAYPDEGEPVIITVYVSEQGFLVSAASGGRRPVSGNTHPTLEAAVANFAVHADRVGLSLRSKER